MRLDHLLSKELYFVPTVVGVLVEYTRVVLPAIFLIGWRHTLNSWVIAKWLYVGALLGVWGIIVLVLPSH